MVIDYSTIKKRDVPSSPKRFPAPGSVRTAGKKSSLVHSLFAYINMEASGGAEDRRTRIDVMPHVASPENAMSRFTGPTPFFLAYAVIKP